MSSTFRTMAQRVTCVAPLVDFLLLAHSKLCTAFLVARPSVRDHVLSVDVFAVFGFGDGMFRISWLPSVSALDHCYCHCTVPLPLMLFTPST